VKVFLTEQDVRERYPWDYKTLGEKCAGRYENFKQDGKFHGLRKPLLGDGRFAHSRYLDPSKPKSGRKDFYSPAIFDALDAHYKKR
jgi:hypothetical protein